MRATRFQLSSGHRLVYADPSYNSTNAKWVSGVTLAAKTPVRNGDVFVVSVQQEVFAVEVLAQTAQPERVEYRWKKIGTPTVKEGSGQNIVLPGAEIKWSFLTDNQGRIYCDPFFLPSKPSYELASPFLRKRIEDVGQEEVQRLRFTRFPWEM